MISEPPALKSDGVWISIIEEFLTGRVSLQVSRFSNGISTTSSETEVEPGYGEFHVSVSLCVRTFRSCRLCRTTRSHADQGSLHWSKQGLSQRFGSQGA